MLRDDENTPLIENLVFPKDANDTPASIAYYQKPNGKFAPVKYDEEGKQVVAVDGIETPFKDINGNSSSALVDSKKRVQTSIATPLPEGDNKIGRVGLAANQPAYEYMHLGLIEAQQEIPESPVGVPMTGFREMNIFIKLEGENPYVTLLPLIWNPLTEMYHIGESKRFTSNLCVTIEVYGAEDIYLLPVELNGKLTVVVAGI